MTHCKGAVRAAAETENPERNGPSSLNPTISSFEDERAALESVTDLLLPRIGNERDFSVVQKLLLYCYGRNIK